MLERRATTSLVARIAKGLDSGSRYYPRGGARQLIRSHVPEIIIAGPAGTGKSRAALEKIHSVATRYPGSRLLILRKTRRSLTSSALVTLENQVLPLGHPARRGPHRTGRSVYRYPNGAEIDIGGLDNPTKVMSSEYDLIYVQEATELTEAEWEVLTTRLRNHRVPYQQLLGDCNPGPPSHWIRQRSEGDLELLESRHEDNPTLIDPLSGQATPEGAEYLSRLDRLTGHRLARLRYGRWVAAEGAVYDSFDRRLHLIRREDLPELIRRWRVIDFGFVNPFVCQWWGEDADGRLYLYREIYHTRRLVEDHARQIARLSGGETYAGPIICDHDAEGRATLERHLATKTQPARKDISAGIEAVKARLRPEEDGKPRLFLLEGALAEADPELLEAKAPWSTEQEFDNYLYPPSRAGRADLELPAKEHDHGMDCLRYLVSAVDQHRPQWQFTPRPPASRRI